ncbi:MAG: SgcJ/EcaC family oxidoreductase [Acidobacteriota bacterium]
MMRIPSPIVPLACLALLSASLAFGQESVETAIRERVRQYEAAYNAGDAEAVAAIYAVDGTHTYALGFTHRGRLEIANGLKELFAGPFKGTRVTISPLHIRALSSDVAVEEASFSIAGLREPGGTDLPPVTGLCLGVYQKQGSLWFAAALQCMVPPPTAQPR